MDVTATDASFSVLLIGISNPATMPGLMDLAVGLQHVTGCELVVSHVVTVRGQMALRSARTSPEVLEAQEFLRSALDYAAGLGVAARAVVEVGRDVDKGLINAAHTHEADIVLLGFSEGANGGSHPDSRRFDRLTHRVSRGVDAHLLVARFRGDDPTSSVLVPVAEGSRMGLLIRALGVVSSAQTVPFLHMSAADDVRSSGDPVRRLLEETGLAQLGTLEIIPSENRSGSVVEEAGQHDLVLLEANPDPSLVEDIFGSAAERIAERVACSSILVRERS